MWKTDNRDYNLQIMACQAEKYRGRRNIEETRVTGAWNEIRRQLCPLISFYKIYFDAKHFTFYACYPIPEAVSCPYANQGNVHKKQFPFYVKLFSKRFGPRTGARFVCAYEAKIKNSLVRG